MTAGYRIRIVLILAMTLLVSAAWANEPYQAEVVGISDGDTITVLHGSVQTKIHLYGIDAPEKSQAFGDRAKEFTSGILSGKAVNVIPMDTDQYGRTVALVQLQDYMGTLNESLVWQGYAWVYREFCRKDFCRDWLDYEEIARSWGIGLWSDPGPVPPWQFRKQN